MKKMLVALLIAAMTLVGMGTSAFAADSDATLNLTITKAMLSTLKNSSNDDTYEFTFTKGDVTQVGTYEASIDNMTLPTSGLVIVKGNIATAPQSSPATVTFSQPGIYTFYVQETDVSNKEVVNTKNMYKVTAKVVNELDTTGALTGNYIVSDSSLVQVNPTTKDTIGDKIDFNEQTITFTNNSTGYNSVKIEKAIKGNAANSTDKHWFKISVTEGTNVGVGYDVTVDNELVTTVSVNTYDDHGNIAEDKGVIVGITPGQVIQVVNLPIGAKYTVKEVGSTLGSVTTWSTDAALTDDQAYQGTASASDTTSISLDRLTANGTVAEGDVPVISYINTRVDQHTPTAFIMNNLPFIVIGIVAIAGIAFFVTKKRNHAEF